MGFFRTERIKCPANQWTYLIDHWFRRTPAGYVIRLRTENGEPLEGEYESKGSRWLFPGTPVRGPLKGELVFERGWFNAFYSVRVRPTVDCIADVD